MFGGAGGKETDMSLPFFRTPRQPASKRHGRPYRAATVEARGTSTLRLATSDGEAIALSGPSAPAQSLLGATVMYRNANSWVVAIDAADPFETVEITPSKVA